MSDAISAEPLNETDALDSYEQFVFENITLRNLLQGAANLLAVATGPERQPGFIDKKWLTTRERLLAASAAVGAAVPGHEIQKLMRSASDNDRIAVRTGLSCAKKAVAEWHEGGLFGPEMTVDKLPEFAANQAAVALPMQYQESPSNILGLQILAKVTAIGFVRRLLAR